MKVHISFQFVAIAKKCFKVKVLLCRFSTRKVSIHNNYYKRNSLGTKAKKKIELDPSIYDKFVHS